MGAARMLTYTHGVPLASVANTTGLYASPPRLKGAAKTVGETGSRLASIGGAMPSSSSANS